MELPLYRIGDQVIVTNGTGFSLGLVKTVNKKAADPSWIYEISIGTSTMTVNESKIKGAVYLSSEKADFAERKSLEESINLD